MKQNQEAVSPVIGVILMVAITVVLATVVFIMVNRLSQDHADETPQTVWTQNQDNGTLTVFSSPPNQAWTDYEVSGCTTVPTGAMTAGQQITGCTGNVLIRYVPTNTVSWQGTFQ